MVFVCFFFLETIDARDMYESRNEGEKRSKLHIKKEKMRRRTLEHLN